jgi:hypothetical protein
MKVARPLVHVGEWIEFDTRNERVRYTAVSVGEGHVHADRLTRSRGEPRMVTVAAAMVLVGKTDDCTLERVILPLSTWHDLGFVAGSAVR